MSTVHKIAVSGAGDLFTRTLLPRVQSDASKRFQVVAASGSPGRTPVLPDGIAAFSSLEAMLAGAEFDTVWILSPTQFHVEQALLSLTAGKSVYLQKPAASSLADFDKIVETVQHSKGKVACAPGQMLSPVIQEMANRIRTGDIGRPYLATTPMMGWGGLELSMPRDPSWRFQAGNGPMRDHGVYSLTTLLTLFGNVRRVAAFAQIATDLRVWQGKKLPVTEADNLAAVLEFESGVLANVIEGWCPGCDSSSVLRVFGLNGILETTGDRWDCHPEGFVVRNADGDPVHEVVGSELGQVKDGQPNDHVWRDVCHLADCIDANLEPASSPRQVRQVYAVIDAIFESSRSGRFVEVPA
jgi:predicted dehydrogenase